MYALPTETLTQISLSQNKSFLNIIREQGIADDLLQMSVTMVESLTETFGTDGTDHPLFRRLNMEEELYQRLGSIINRRREVGDEGLAPDDYALLLTVPFAFSAEQIGPAFGEDFKERVLQIRKTSAPQMVEALEETFEPLNPDNYIPVMSILGNALFGRISRLAGAREKMIEDMVVDVLNEKGLRRLVAELIYDLETSTGGDNLPAVFRERVAFSRAGIKKPDILILGNSLASHDSDARELMRERVSNLMPETTKIFIEKKIVNPNSYDLYVEIKDGRIDGGARQDIEQDTDARQNLNRKITEISKTDLFGELDRKQQRLLAFGAQWFEAKADQTIFAQNDAADAVFLCISGLAGLYRTDEGQAPRLVTKVQPGRLIGDLSIILSEQRPLDLVALEDSVFLRIGAGEFMAVIENDAMVASSLMKSVANNMKGAIDSTRALRAYSSERGVDLTEFDSNRKAL